MKKSYKKQFLSTLILTGAMLISGSGVAAETFPMDAKLKQCEMAFNKAHSGELTLAEAGKARQNHMELVMEILENINKRNAEVDIATGESLTSKEIVNNFRVMGRMLEMMAVDHQGAKTEWNYAY